MKPNFSDFPVLITKRLSLRFTKKEDVLMVYKLRSDATLNQFIKREKTKNIQDAYDFIEMITTDFIKGKSISWVISMKGNSEMIGSICLWNFSEDEYIAEVGYALDTKSQHQGIMSEALKAVVEFGFEVLKLNMIEAYTSFKNEPSKRLLLKNGFVLNQNKKDMDDTDNLIFEKHRDS